MKKHMLLVLVSAALSFGVQAKIAVCRNVGAIQMNASADYFSLGGTAENCATSGLLHITMFDNIYLASELDKKFNAHQERIFNIEQALQQETVIPESVIAKIKNDLKEELKAELKNEIKLEILKELGSK